MIEMIYSGIRKIIFYLVAILFLFLAGIYFVLFIVLLVVVIIFLLIGFFGYAIFAIGIDMI